MHCVFTPEAGSDFKFDYFKLEIRGSGQADIKARLKKHVEVEAESSLVTPEEDAVSKIINVRVDAERVEVIGSL